MTILSFPGSNSYTPLPSSPNSASPPSSPTPTHARPPLDPPHDLILLSAFFLLGIGVLLPWNAFLSTLDFYTILFPTISITQFITNCYTFPFMLIGIALAISTTHPPRRFALFAGFSALTLISIFLPLLTRARQPITTSPFLTPTFWFTVSSALIIGAVSALLQSTLFAVLTCFSGDRYTAAFTTGGGVASVFIVILRIVCRLLMTDAGKHLYDLQHGFQVFFVTCALLCAVCVLVMFGLETSCNQYLVRVADMNKNNGMEGDVRLTLGELWAVGLNVFASMAITLAIFPGILVKLPMTMREVVGETMKSWYPLIVIAVFAVGDTIGRAAAGEEMIHRWKRGLTALVTVRIVSLPVYVGLWGGMGRIGWGGVWSLVMFLGLANGMVVTMGFLRLPHLVPMERRAIAGRLMFVSLISGISVGNFLGWIIEVTLKRFIEF